MHGTNTIIIVTTLLKPFQNSVQRLLFEPINKNRSLLDNFAQGLDYKTDTKLVLYTWSKELQTTVSVYEISENSCTFKSDIQTETERKRERIYSRLKAIVTLHV